MRLVELSANKPSFRPVRFNRQGLSLVVAEQTKGSGPTGTYNGVGKSLMFALLNYCLGSNTRRSFETNLKGWEFFLTIDVDGVEHKIARKADAPNALALDGAQLTLAKLREFLEEKSFEQTLTHKHLTFRSIVPLFLRSRRGAYVEFTYIASDEVKKPYGAMLRNAFLLGLDITLAERKFKLRSRQQSLTKTIQNLEKDPLFAELMQQDALEIELQARREEASRLEEDLHSFKVAENYREVERDGDQVKKQLSLYRREVVKLSEAIDQIDRSLQTDDDLPADLVLKMYDEVGISMPELVKRRMEEVKSFQGDLLRKRLFRLSRERQELQKELKKQEASIQTSSARLDKVLGYLGEHRALDEYTAMNRILAEKKAQIAKLEQSKALRDRVDRELKRIERDLAEENIRADDYLESVDALIGEATRTFRSFAKELYGMAPSGLSVKNDSGNNQERYRIDAHITSDAAEGINEAKIFCFDMTLFSLQRGHRFQFVAHDSTLFGPVDPRQKLAMFRIADRICKEKGLQYIAALNAHDISSLEQQVDVSKEEMRRLFVDPVVLRLTDESPESKLLGVQIDMDYTKD